MTRPDMSIKVERQLHDMRILGRIVGVRSTEQFVWHLLTPTSIDLEQNKFLKYKNVICLKNEKIKSISKKQGNLTICELREERK